MYSYKHLPEVLGGGVYISSELGHNESRTITGWGPGIYEITEAKYQEKHSLFYIDTNANVFWLADSGNYNSDIFSITLSGGVINITNTSPNNLIYTFRLKRYM